MVDYLDLSQALKAKAGAAEDRQRDHVFYYITVKGREERATKLSHGAKGQFPSPLLGTIARQMRLTSAELRRFVNCELEGEEFLALWQQRAPWPLSGKRGW